MRYLIFLYALILSNHARPVEEEPYSQENESIAELHRQFKLVTYVENFKQILSEYVKKAYQYLTIRDMETVKMILEEFLKNFSNHLRDILKGNTIEDMDFNKKIEDGIPDKNFDIIRDKVKEEYKDLNEETTNKIVYVLRRELYMTRRLLDHVIEESKRALEANSH